MKVRCVVVDDEPFARNGLEGYVGEIDGLELVGICKDTRDLKKLLAVAKIDLIFLDIEMPRQSGIEFLQEFENPPMIIFTTAFEEYALQGFDLNVIDYLLKPISFVRFEQGARKALDYFKLQSGSEESESILIKFDKKLIRLPLWDILFLEWMQNDVLIYTVEDVYRTRQTLKNMLQRLPKNQFIQTHKSYIVSIPWVYNIEGNVLNIKDYKVPVSRQLKRAVVNRISKNLHTH